MNYDKAYFIAKFEAIPDELWCVGLLNDGDQHCVLGHCQWTRSGRTTEQQALIDLFGNYPATTCSLQTPPSNGIGGAA